MKFTESWLREWVNPTLNTEQLAEQLTMAGLEVDSLTPLADVFSGVVVGQIVACGQHPNADKLSVCQVDTGTGTPHPIVCGGDNLRVGMKIALATVGAILPGNFKIKKSKLRGEPSHGMICSAKELGIDAPSETPKGIMELHDDAPLGTDLRDYLKLDDCVIDIELTPNRGDCASVKGVARDVGVLNQMPVQSVAIPPAAKLSKETFPVTVENTASCPRYAGRVLSGINANAKTPLWLATRLERCGIRCIHPVVDVCNYVMLELGQPMHGFDLDALDGEIVVRAAQKGEKAKLLDEQVVTLQLNDLVIADKKGVQAIAGVMGGFDSGVTEATRHVFLESAFFDPIAISLTARRLGIVSDSSYRFERGVDYALQVPALERATALLLEIVGGQPGPVIELTDANTLPQSAVISLRRARISHVLGIEIGDAHVTRILEALGMSIEPTGIGWSVHVPSFRPDITIEVDLIEELARIYGYQHIPSCDLKAPLIIDTRHKTPEIRIADLLVDRGYHEVITYSFVNDAQQQLINSDQSAVLVQNPIASDMNAMRTSLWPGLLSTLLYNQNRQVQRQKLFEQGLCFWQEGKAIQQESYIGLVAVGDAQVEQWGVSARPIDFFDVKGDFELLTTLTHSEALRFEMGTHPALHPGKSADVFQGKVLVGHMGVLHPRLTKQLGLRQAPVLAQIKSSSLLGGNDIQFEKISKFPSVRRDLALLVNEDVTVREILQLVTSKADATLNKAQIFDLYQGEGIEKGKKSIALGLTFQDPSRTLVDADINSAIEQIIKALKEDLKATLRT